MENPHEAAIRACPKSKYKDDRHEWRTLASENHFIITSAVQRPEYYIRRCADCRLVVFLTARPYVPWDGGIGTDDTIHFAMYESPR